LNGEQRQVLGQIQQASPQIAASYALFHQFAGLFQTKASEKVRVWLEAAQTSGLAEIQNFAVGLEKDLAAVTNAISLAWSNGQTEGQVNRLKMLKRQMYGRANFDLLRRRVLYA
jgi:transposase